VCRTFASHRTCRELSSTDFASRTSGQTIAQTYMELGAYGDSIGRPDAEGVRSSRGLSQLALASRGRHLHAAPQLRRDRAVRAESGDGGHPGEHLDVPLRDPQRACSRLPATGDVPRNAARRGGDDRRCARRCATCSTPSEPNPTLVVTGGPTFCSPTPAASSCSPSSRPRVAWKKQRSRLMVLSDARAQAVHRRTSAEVAKPRHDRMRGELSACASDRAADEEMLAHAVAAWRGTERIMRGRSIRRRCWSRSKLAARGLALDLVHDHHDPGHAARHPPCRSPHRDAVPDRRRQPRGPRLPFSAERRLKGA